MHVKPEDIVRHQNIQRIAARFAPSCMRQILQRHLARNHLKRTERQLRAAHPEGIGRVKARLPEVSRPEAAILIRKDLRETDLVTLIDRRRKRKLIQAERLLHPGRIRKTRPVVEVPQPPAVRRREAIAGLRC